MVAERESATTDPLVAPRAAHEPHRRHAAARAAPDPEARPAGLPSPWDALAWQPLATARNATKSRVFVAQHGGRLVVCKDVSHTADRPVLGAFRRWTLRNEVRALRRLAGLPGVPPLLASWRGGLVMGHLPGRLLSDLRGQRVQPEVFDHLDALVAEAHARDLVLVDLHRRNVLVDEAGGTGVVDFEMALDTRAGLGRWLGREWLRRVDRHGVAKQRRSFGAPLLPEQRALLDRPPAPYRFGHWLKRWRSQRLRRGADVGLLARVARGFRKRGVAGSLRVLSVLALVGVLLALSRPTPLSVALGAPLVLLGEAWRAWAAGHLLKSKELAMSGPYRHVQNPLYLGRLCILCGLGLMALVPLPVGGHELPANLGLLALLLVGFFAYYLPRKQRVEGARLRRLHGAAWERWAAAVPVILPSRRPWGRNLRPWSAARFADNGEGWMVAFVLAVTAAFCVRAALGS